MCLCSCETDSYVSISSCWVPKMTWLWMFSTRSDWQRVRPAPQTDVGRVYSTSSRADLGSERRCQMCSKTSGIRRERSPSVCVCVGWGWFMRKIISLWCWPLGLRSECFILVSDLLVMIGGGDLCVFRILNKNNGTISNLFPYLMLQSSVFWPLSGSGARSVE